MTESANFQIHGEPAQVAELFAALATAQGSFQPIVRNKLVKVKSEKANYEFWYAPLEAIKAATVPSLSANGLASWGAIFEAGERTAVRHILSHSSGAFVETTMTVANTTTAWDKNGNRYERLKSSQELASSITYIRRYLEQTALGVTAEDDDDGAGGEGMSRETETKAQPSKPLPVPPKVEKPAARAPEKAAAKPVEQSAPSTPAKAAEPTLPGVDTSQKAPDALVGENARPASVPPPAEKQMAPGEPASPPEVPPVGLADKVTAASTAKMKALIAELVPPVGTNGQTRGDWVREWCVKVLGKPTDKVTLEAEIQVLIADLEMRKAAV